MGQELYLTLRRWHAENEPVMQDVKDFMLAYCACFVAMSVFIF